MSPAPEFFVRNAFALAGSVVIFCESIATFDDERRLIWRRPVNWVKGMYVITRYSSLMASIANMVILFHGPLRLYPNHRDDCRFWHSIFAVMSCTPMVAIDVFSVTRVFLLYQPDWRVGIFAASLVITQLVLVSVSSSNAIETSVFTPDCSIVSTPRQILAFVSWLVVTQLCIIGLTFYKLRSLFKGRQQGSTVYLVLQHGIFLNSVLLVVTFGALIFSLIIGVSNPNVVAIWPGVINSCLFCRVLLHLRCSALKQDIEIKLEQMAELDAQFTSWLSSPSEQSHLIVCSIGDSVLRRRPCSSISDKLEGVQSIEGRVA